MKSNKFLLIVSILTLIFVLVGATFSYFTTGVRSETGATSATSARVGINLSALALYNYNDRQLIPTNDDDIMTAYQHKCIDIHDYGACQAYTITIENVGKALEYSGTIEFKLDEVTNLNYLILDENDEIYLDKTGIVSETEQSLGEAFDLAENETKVFKLLIWVPNYNYNQNEEDSSGKFDAIITYKSTSNYIISGTISNN